jgi:hypothetical protein
VKRLAAVGAAVTLVCGVGAAGSAAMPRPLQLGVVGDPFLSTDAGLRDAWMDRAREARANLVLLGVGWSGIAPATRPAGFDPADPADPAYKWEALDGAVRSAVSRGMQPVLPIDYAPAWAEGPGRPSFEEAPSGSWMPSPRELARFSRAIATRYSGRFVDPAHPEAGALPRVRYFQVWQEQNLAVHLAPQWRGGKLVGPAHYRKMLNAAYAAIRGVNSGARVLVGGLSPYGNPTRSGGRVPPVWFWRSLLCLRGSGLRPVRCPNPARFDIAAHNPINVGGPSRRALNPFDISTPDIDKMTSIVRRAVQTRRLLPAKPKPFWATEIWWDSKPPDPGGVPARRHARSVTKALYSLWQQGASAVIWWYIRDQSYATGFNGTQQSGLFFRDGRQKLAYRAFRFPFIAGRPQGGQLFVWGKAPKTGRLVVERRTGAGWRPLTRLSAWRNGIFSTRLDARGKFKLRARQGSQTSLPWRAR